MRRRRRRLLRGRRTGRGSERGRARPQPLAVTGPRPRGTPVGGRAPAAARRAEGIGAAAAVATGAERPRSVVVQKPYSAWTAAAFTERAPADSPLHTRTNTPRPPSRRFSFTLVSVLYAYVFCAFSPRHGDQVKRAEFQKKINTIANVSSYLIRDPFYTRAPSREPSNVYIVLRHSCVIIIHDNTFKLFAKKPCQYNSTQMVTMSAYSQFGYAYPTPGQQVIDNIYYNAIPKYLSVEEKNSIRYSLSIRFIWVYTAGSLIVWVSTRRI